MARGRVITPDFWSDGNMVGVSAFARLFYIGTWNFAYCDKGHLDDDPMGLKLKILPADDVDPVGLLSELMGRGRITRLIAGNGKSFLFIPTFSRWQKADPRWKTRCPACALINSGELFETQKSLGEHSETLPSSALRGEKRTRENQREENRTPLVAVVSLFAEVWSHWPKKDDKKDAEAKWPRAVRESGMSERELADVAIAHGEAYRAYKSKQFTPAFVVWLNKGRWTNDLPAPEETSRPAKPSKGDQILDVLEMGRRMQAASDQKGISA